MTSRDLQSLDVNEPRGAVTPRVLRRAIRRQEQAEYGIYCRQIQLDTLVEFDRQDVEATGDALMFALKEEFRFVDEVRADAHGDPVKLELGASKITFFAASNNARARRRFGRLG